MLSVKSNVERRIILGNQGQKNLPREKITKKSTEGHWSHHSRLASVGESTTGTRSP